MNFVVNGTILLVLILKLKRKYLVCGSVNVDMDPELSQKLKFLNGNFFTMYLVCHPLAASVL